MTVASIMHPDPLTLRADQTVGEAIRILREHRFRSVPVIESDGTMIGQFSVRTILSLLLPKVATLRGGLRRISFMHDSMEDLQRRLSDNLDEPLRDHAHTNVECVATDDPLSQTVLALFEKQENLPVINEVGKLVGILSYWDVVDHLVEGTNEK